MASHRYLINDQNELYFLTCTVVQWIDLFTRIEYKQVIVESLTYCIKNKGLEIFGWVLMTNHLHLICRCKETFRMSDFLRDFKKFTSKRLIDIILEIPENRREWLLDKFSFTARSTHRAENFKLWKDGNHAICLAHIDAFQKLDYVHLNPVSAGIVEEPHHYIYGSAIDYAGGKGLIDIVIL